MPYCSKISWVSGCSVLRPLRSAHSVVMPWLLDFQAPYMTASLSELSVPTISLSYKDNTGLILLSERDFGILCELKFLLSHLLFLSEYTCCFSRTE